MQPPDTGRAPRRLMVGVAVEGAMFANDQQHRLLDVARLADEIGLDFLSVPEHVLVGQHADAQDPWSSWAPEHLDMQWPEPMVTLAAMAGATRQVKLLSAVVIAPLRPAGLLAKQAGTLHAISRGRFILGVSPSWHKDEYDALGVSFERRGQILEDTLGACRALWEQAPASFHSPTVNFDGLFCQPRPLPGERIPIWLTGKFTPRLVRRMVALGDGWMPYGAYGMSLEEKAEAVSLLRRRWQAAGRRLEDLALVDSLPVVGGSLGASLEQAPALAAAGFTGIRIPLRRLVRAPEEVEGVLRSLGQRLAELRAIPLTA